LELNGVINKDIEVYFLSMAKVFEKYLNALEKASIEDKMPFLIQRAKESKFKIVI